MKAALLGDVEIAQCVRMWNRLDWALAGIGAIVGVADNLFMARVKAAEERTGRKVAADICGRFMDENGQAIDEVVDVQMAIDLKTLHKANKVVAVAGGKNKAQAINAALRGGFVEVLVTDVASAETIMKIGA